MKLEEEAESSNQLRSAGDGKTSAGSRWSLCQTGWKHKSLFWVEKQQPGFYLKKYEIWRRQERFCKSTSAKERRREKKNKLQQAVSGNAEQRCGLCQSRARIPCLPLSSLILRFVTNCDLPTSKVHCCAFSLDRNVRVK